MDRLARDKFGGHETQTKELDALIREGLTVHPLQRSPYTQDLRPHLVAFLSFTNKVSAFASASAVPK